MAQAQAYADKAGSQSQIGRLTAESQERLVKYGNVILEMHNKSYELREKLTLIDIAFARYQASQDEDGTGRDEIAGQQACGVNADDIIVPIVVSQVESYHAYLNDVFLSGYPVFPVVSTPNTIEDAQKLQAIIDDHATRGRWQRHLSLNFLDGIKYNLSGLEVDWCSLDIMNLSSSISEPTRDRIERKPYYINKLKKLDTYNLILDPRVDPVDIPMSGEFAGYVEIISRIELKRRLTYAASSGYGYNTSQSFATSLGNPPAGPSASYGYYNEKPTISSLISPQTRNVPITDWLAYLTSARKKTSDRISSMSDIYEYVTIYARIIPEEFGITVPRKNTPQVWKLCYVNHEKLVYAEPIFTIYDMLPIYIAQPHEDGFSLQTKSVGENAIPFQEANTKLFSIRLNAARRAIVDRAIYDQTVISPNDVNSPYPAAKIPMKSNALLGQKTLDQVYKSIPFDARGTETVVADMQMISGMADEINGVNKPQRGQFQKGNKSRREWEDTMAGSYGRMRNAAIMFHYQQIISVQEQIKFNIYHRGAVGQYQDQSTGSVYEVTPQDIERLRKTVNNFKLADGLIPADKMASTDFLVQGMNMLSTSPVLQQSLGAMLPRMFFHLMNLGGVQNLEQYLPQQAPPQASGQAPQAGQPAP